MGALFSHERSRKVESYYASEALLHPDHKSLHAQNLASPTRTPPPPALFSFSHSRSPLPSRRSASSSEGQCRESGSEQGRGGRGGERGGHGGAGAARPDCARPHLRAALHVRCALRRRRRRPCLTSSAASSSATAPSTCVRPGSRPASRRRGRTSMSSPTAPRSSFSTLCLLYPLHMSSLFGYELVST